MPTNFFFNFRSIENTIIPLCSKIPIFRTLVQIDQSNLMIENNCSPPPTFKACAFLTKQMTRIPLSDKLKVKCKRNRFFQKYSISENSPAIPLEFQIEIGKALRKMELR